MEHETKIYRWDFGSNSTVVSPKKTLIINLNFFPSFNIFFPWP
jgi:hypothetical protein